MIKVTDLTKTYVSGSIETPVLKGIDLEIGDGEFVSIMGRSGAGKSTLMYQVSLLDDPTTGKVFLNGVDMDTLDRAQRTNYRLHNLGFIFQDYALIPELTAIENVMLPLLMQGKDTRQALDESYLRLVELGLENHVDNLPSQLSGGEQQRVSIARSIVHKPKILFADEPTANLDSESALRVIEILKELNRQGQTIVMITHEEEYGKRTKRIIRLSDGRVESDTCTDGKPQT